MILVVCALAAELAGFTVNAETELLACGIGLVEAAGATARALAMHRYDAVISAGIAGVFRGCGKVGDACIVGEESFAAFGWEDGGTPTLGEGMHLIRCAQASFALLEHIRALPYRIVRGLTTTQVTTTNTTALRLRETYAAEIETMEGFAVFRAAEAAGIPVIGVRGISNIVGERAESCWDFQVGSHAAVEALTQILLYLQ
jgi:futalosine hydrolase